MKISAWWLAFAVIVGLAAAYIYFKVIYTPSETFTVNKRKNYDVITLALPTNSDPAVFGPKYWETFHKLADRIPCPSCRAKAVPFMSFFHDIVNLKTEKPLYDKENFNKHIEAICNLPKA